MSFLRACRIRAALSSAAVLVLGLPRLLVAQPGSGPAVATPVVLTIEGGGSLGVHEAGMTWAFVEMFKRSDAARGARDPRLPLLRLEAVSGASAGSINALLAATAWCDARQDIPPERSTFWQTWVPTGVQQLLPQHGMEGFRQAAGVFSRVYHRDVLYPMLDSAWADAEWVSPAQCRGIPVGATLTRLRPERVPLGDGHVSATNQRWAATFSVATRQVGGKNQLVFLARPDDARSPALGTVAVPLAGADGAIAHQHVFDIFAASSGYPLAFGPYTVSYRRLDSGRWRTERAQFIDGGVFDNGPLGLGLALWFDGKHWPAEMARDPGRRFPRTVFISPGRPRIWPDRRVEDNLTSADDPAKLIDPRASGVTAVFNLIGGAVPSARQYELQQTLRLLSGTQVARDSAPAHRLADSVSVSGRWHPIVGSRLGGFAGFLGRPFREYDFYVGIYDAFATVAEAICEGQSHSASPEERFRCVSGHVGDFVSQPPIALGAVAPTVLRALYAREFERGTGQPKSPMTGSGRLTTQVDSATHLMLVLERAMGAFMHDPSSEADRDKVARLRECPGQGGPLVGVVCGSGLHAVLEVLRADPVVRKMVRDARESGGERCSRRALPRTSHACMVDERFVELMDHPMQEMHRVARSLIDRIVVTTPDSSSADLAVRALGAYYFSSDGRYRRGADMGQTSVPSREPEWHFLPSSATASVGIPGAIIGYEGRLNPTSRLALVLPVRVAFGRFQPKADHRSDRINRFIIGPAIEYKRDGKLASLRAGYNLWFGTDSISRAAPLRDLGAPYVGAALFASKLRVSIGPPPKSLTGARPNGWIGEVGVNDLNGILYWAIQGARGGRIPLRSEPTDSLGCVAAVPTIARRLPVGDSIVAAVRANAKSNATGVMVDSGAVYRIAATGYWKDGRVRPVTAEGFRSTQAPFYGVPMMWVGQLFRREHGARWFELIGELPAGSGSHVRLTQNGGEWKAPRSGELATFANDVPQMYNNNRGCLTLTITRLQ